MSRWLTEETRAGEKVEEREETRPTSKVRVDIFFAQIHPLDIFVQKISQIYGFSSIWQNDAEEK